MAVPSRTLAEEFMVAISTGQLHVSDAALYAHARVDEGGADPQMQALAHCHGTTAERQLHAWADKQPWRQALPQPYSFSAPLARAGGGVEAGTLH